MVMRLHVDGRAGTGAADKSDADGNLLASRTFGDLRRYYAIRRTNDLRRSAPAGSGKSCAAVQAGSTQNGPHNGPLCIFRERSVRWPLDKEERLCYNNA